MTTHSEADMADARDVLSWLLTDHAAALYALVFRLALGDAAMTAVVSNAGRAWNEACATLAHVQPVADGEQTGGGSD